MAAVIVLTTDKTWKYTKAGIFLIFPRQGEELSYLFDFGQSHSPPLCILKQGSDEILDLRTREFHGEWPFAISPSDERKPK